MAKSIRSKRRRKMRAVKRVRYGLKELERLKKTVGVDDIKKEIDEVMQEVSDVVIMSDSKSIIESANQTEEPEKMDDNSVKHIYNPKTFRDQFGTCPVWMSQRRARKNSRKKKSKVKSKNKGKGNKK